MHSRALFFGSLLLFSAGCSRESERPRPLSEIIADYDRNIDSMRTLVKADSLNSELVSNLAAAMLKKVDFATELLPQYVPFVRVDPLIDEAVRLTERGTAHDSGSSRLFGMLGKAHLYEYLAKRSYQDTESSRKGMKALDEAIRLDSANTDACITQAMFLIMTAPYNPFSDKVKFLLTSVLRRDPQNGTAYFFLSRMYGYRDPSEDQLEEMSEYVRDAEKIGVDDADWWFSLGQRYIWRTEPHSLYENGAYIRRVKNVPGPMKAFFFLVANPLLASRETRQMRFIEKALEVNPYHLPSLIAAARQSFDKGNDKEAFVYYQRADAVDSNYSRWWGFWGYNGAAFFRAVLKKFPENYRACLNLADLSHDSGEVRAAYEKAIALKPHLPLPYVDLAEIYVHDGRFGEAEDLVSRAAASGADSGLTYESPAYFRLSESYAKIGQDSLMLKAFRKGLDRGNAGIYGVYNIAAVYRDKGDKRTARKVYDLYLSKMGRRKGNELNVARAYDELEELENAAKWYERAVDSTPDSIEGDVLAPIRKADILFSLADVRSRQERYDDAIHIYEKVIKLSGNAAGMHRLIGHNYRLKGDLLKARDALLKSVAESDREVLSFYELGLTYKALKENEKARAAFQRAGDGGVQAAREELAKMAGGK
jgi:tetratricopeptide (TPR) repeat protein